MNISVGEVIAVNGLKVTLRVFEESSKETLFYSGEKYKGVSIREYISIQRGFRDVVCIIEGEYLDENKYEVDGNKTNYIRKVDAKPIGYFENGKFYDGVKFLPMIKDFAFLLKEDRISEIYSKGKTTDFIIGEMLKEELPISLPWETLFNSHIAIFGNTGSGKSNTLAKLYTVLFDKKIQLMENKSKFVILDFNGEYTGEQLSEARYKTILKLNTQSDGEDKFPIYEEEFWNAETLSILFQATPNTQKPFLNRLISGRKRFIDVQDSLLIYIKSVFSSVFSTASPKPEALDLLRNITKILGPSPLNDMLREIKWVGGNAQTFVGPGPNDYFNADGATYTRILSGLVNQIQTNNLDAFDELIVRANLQLTRDFNNSFVQFDHIQPLLKRIDSSLSSLRKVVEIVGGDNSFNLLTIVSLRKCNQEVKKILPLLIAKHFYHEHKKEVENPPNKTMHLIIDEAHNILSQQSSNEHESWKDYRLELFEEIIKEGRKFGMFITISSQRPADISPTIVSQVHNFFIHRLVNDRDLFLLDNTISTLDSLSRGMIPNLSKGCCIATGTSFDLPILLQVHRLDKNKQPDSEDVNLNSLWS